MASLVDNESKPQISLWDRFNQKANEGVEFTKNCYTKFNNDHPKLVSVIKKIIPFALAAFAALLNPIATVVGFSVGLIFAKQIAPVINKVKEWVKDAFASSNILGKSLIAAGAIVSVIFIPSIVTSALVGANAGCTAKKLLSK